jgi:hypothetical protein
MLRRVYGIHRLITVTTVFLAISVLWQSVSGDERLPRPEQPATLFGVGDIMHCASPENAELTGQLMTRLLNDTPNSIAVTFGDNSNDDGAEGEYDCFNRSSWGALNSRIYPTPGNHDYGTDKVLPFYFLYFVNAGAPGVGYYAYDFGSWRIYAINSELIAPSARQQQLDWLEQELRVHSREKCTFAYFHRPPFSSGNFASPAWVLPIFRKLYKYGVDLVATGHEHFFAALPPLNPDGAVDRATGVPMLIAGTGGAVFFGRPPRLRYADAGEVLVARSLGILKVTFQPAAYEWAFVPVDASDASPSGSGRCHDNPPGVP